MWRNVWITVAAIALLLSSIAVAAEPDKRAGPVASGLKLPVSMSCAGGMARLGGTCRGRQWVEDNLATSELLGYGACPTGSGCAIWFSELDRHDTLSFKSTIHFVADTTCMAGRMNCVGGYDVIGRMQFKYAFDSDGQPSGESGSRRCTEQAC